MALAPATQPGWIRMFHPDISGSETYVKMSAYRAVWYFQGWRSLDDPYVPDPSEETNLWDLGPAELLPLTVSRQAPWAGWTQFDGLPLSFQSFGGMRVTSAWAAAPLLSAMPPTGIGATDVMYLVKTDQSVRVRLINFLVSYLGVDLTDSGHTTRISALIGISESEDPPEWVTLAEVPTFGLPVLMAPPSPDEMDDYLAAGTQDVDIIENLPANSAILQMRLQVFLDEEEVDPAEQIGMMLHQLSLYESDQAADPRLDLNQGNLFSGMNTPVVIRSRTVGESEWLTDMSSDEIVWSRYGLNLDGSLEIVASATLEAELVGEADVPSLMASRLRVDGDPEDDLDVVRKQDLDEAISGVAGSLVAPATQFSSEEGSGAVPSPEWLIPYEYEVVERRVEASGGEAVLTFANPGADVKRRFLLRLRCSNTVVNTWDIPGYVSVSETIPSEHLLYSLWMVEVNGSGTADVGDPASVFMHLLSTEDGA